MKFKRHLLGIVIGLSIVLLFSNFYFDFKDTVLRFTWYKTTCSPYEKEIERKSGNLKVGMSRKEVEKVMIIPPDDVLTNESAGEVTWYWSCFDRASKQKVKIGKGHFTLAVSFNSEGKVIEVSKGVN
jgi:hypothetical protein